MPAVNNNSGIVDFKEANITGSFDFKEKMTGQTGNDGTKTLK